VVDWFVTLSLPVAARLFVLGEGGNEGAKGPQGCVGWWGRALFVTVGVGCAFALVMLQEEVYVMSWVGLCLLLVGRSGAGSACEVLGGAGAAGGEIVTRKREKEE
jgi:hypothetical protein